jgi:hypothetical protein
VSPTRAPTGRLAGDEQGVMTVGIGLCGLDDVDALMAFIREEWGSDHVLGNHRPLLDFQHRDDAAGHYDVLLARDDDEIVGMLGFIRASRYDPALRDDDTVWLTTWKVRDTHAHGLGLGLLRRLESMLDPSWIGTVGLNEATRGIYEVLGYTTGTLDRYFLLNDTLGGHRLARYAGEAALAPPKDGSATILTPGADRFLADTEGIGIDERSPVPRKSRRYVVDRYLHHPYYSYTPLVVRDGDRAAVLVTRLCDHAGAKALRVVDVVGDVDALAGCGPALYGVMVDAAAEYVDLYCTGVGEQLRAAGLHDLADHPDVVLPNHFEPFERRNVDLPFAFRGRDGTVVLCKGDADQDRPNRIGNGP